MSVSEKVSSKELGLKMREGMRRLPSGVSVLTANHGDSRYAMTASSVTSVSDSPASLLVCVNKTARFSKPMLEGRKFCVNILSSSQQDISNLCAIPNDEELRFSKGDWRQDKETGLYYLADAQAAFLCEKANQVDHGTHTVFIGNILDVVVSEKEIDPLMYLNGRYLGHL